MTDKLTPAVIAELRVLAGKATPRPWTYGGHLKPDLRIIWSLQSLFDIAWIPDVNQDANGEFITAAVNHLDALLDAAEAMRWISVEERFPEVKKDTLFLVFRPEHGERVNVTTFWHDTKVFNLSGVTHWMPMPQPPEPQGE